MIRFSKSTSFGEMVFLAKVDIQIISFWYQCKAYDPCMISKEKISSFFCKKTRQFPFKHKLRYFYFRRMNFISSGGMRRLWWPYLNESANELLILFWISWYMKVQRVFSRFFGWHLAKWDSLKLRCNVYIFRFPQFKMSNFLVC